MTLKAETARKMCENAKESIHLKAIEDAKSIRKGWDSAIEERAKGGEDYKFFYRPDNNEVWEHLWKGLQADGFRIDFVEEFNRVRVSW